MKNKRNKIINLFKIGILLFGISFFLWNCEQDTFVQEQQIENSTNPLFTEFQINLL